MPICDFKALTERETATYRWDGSLKKIVVDDLAPKILKAKV